jgi:hypothetical protein
LKVAAKAYGSICNSKERCQPKRGAKEERCEVQGKSEH